jgi:hypothetical protein
MNPAPAGAKCPLVAVLPKAVQRNTFPYTTYDYTDPDSGLVLPYITSRYFVR